MSYSALLSATCWAAFICGAAGEIVSAREAGSLAAAREERCVVTLGRQLSDLEAQVAPFLNAYRDAIQPELGRDQSAGQQRTP